MPADDIIHQTTAALTQESLVRVLSSPLYLLLPKKREKKRTLAHPVIIFTSGITVTESTRQAHTEQVKQSQEIPLGTNCFSRCEDHPAIIQRNNNNVQ